MEFCSRADKPEVPLSALGIPVSASDRPDGTYVIQDVIRHKGSYLPPGTGPGQFPSYRDVFKGIDVSVFATLTLSLSCCSSSSTVAPV